MIKTISVTISFYGAGTINDVIIELRGQPSLIDFKSTLMASPRTADSSAIFSRCSGLVFFSFFFMGCYLVFIGSSVPSERPIKKELEPVPSFNGLLI